MTYQKRGLLLLGLALVLVLALTACGQQGETPAPTQPPEPTPVITSAAPTQGAQPTEGAAPPEGGEGAGTGEIEVPFLDAWRSSGHAQADAPAFTHWNEEDPQEIPTECAKCHSTPGFQDYVGADGSAFGEVNQAAAVGTTVTCVACHNDATMNLGTVRFPSGVELTDVGESAQCMTCHQGTASKVQVDEAIAAAGATDEDTVVAELGFTNIHYYAAAVTRYGKVVKGGYEYDGKQYDALFDHVPQYDECQECHDPHTTEVVVEECTACHEGAASVEDLRNIRMVSSAMDYDGDGDVEEGVAFEIDGLRELLYQAIQAYATEVSQTPIVYNPAAYPYFFIDTNSDGEAGDDESQFPNRYNAWTPRLEKAAYNFQTSLKDPGQYAHGGKYIIQLLYDSIENLNEQLGTPVDITAASRIDAGHFAGSDEAFRHWDEEEGMMVEANCVKCHAGGGLPIFLANNANLPVRATNGLTCETCHSNLQDYAVYEIEEVAFPSGARVSLGDSQNNLCLECHQGRESTVSVNRVIGDLPVDQPSENLRFRNIHYFATAASLFGTEVKGGYEFENQEYNGRFMHVEGFQTCTDCHDAHNGQVAFEACEGCHGSADPAAIRGESAADIDFDGDGDAEEGLRGEIETMQEALYAAIQAYAADRLDAPILYDSHRYPYFFGDANGNGTLDEGEEGFAGWSPRLLQSAYNYQFTLKDPGGYVHNGRYHLQLLFDSIRNLNGNTQGMTRPDVTAPAAEE